MIIQTDSAFGVERSTARVTWNRGRHVWLAKIMGPHSKYGLDRKFCKKSEHGVGSGGRSGALFFDMMGPGVYEYSGFLFHKLSQRGFFRLHEDGRIELLSKNEVYSELMQAEAPAAA